MNEARMIGIIILSAVITFSLRAFPFLIFRGKRRMPERLVYLEISCLRLLWRY